MQINIAGHHVEITPAIDAKVREKLAKVANHYPDIDQVSVYLTVEPKRHKAEIVTQYHQAQVAVHANSDSLYTAIRDVAKKLDSALRHRDGVLHSHNRDKPVLEQAEEPTEETFEE